MTVCSGIGAPEHAAPWIDWRYQSEIDKFAAAVLRERFPDAANLGDMTKFKEWPDATIDVLCGGTPCQSFSVAGLRKGLDDPRGNLALTYLAIAAKYRPRWIVWENVPGVYSATSHDAPDICPPDIDLDSGDGPGDGEEIVVTDEYEADESHAFSCFLAGLSELGYGFAYRTLDVQYGRTLRFPFAIPQRRRRVFVVGYLRDWRRAAEVLLERESLSRHPPPRRDARQGTAPTLAARTRGASGQQSLDAETETLIAFDCKGSQVQHDDGGASPTLRAMAGAEAHANGGGQLAVAFDLNQITSPTNKSRPDPSVLHTMPASSCPPHLATQWAVRRLTPVECERLMGFPDNWTQIPWRGKPAEQCPDGRRYKALGNSWGVNAGEYIFDRMRWVESL